MRENTEMSKSNINKHNFDESILQSAATLAETYNQKYLDISKAVESADVAEKPFKSLFSANSDAIATASSCAEISNLVTLKSPTDTIENALKATTTTTNLGKPNLIVSYNSAIKAQKSLGINNMFENGISEITANVTDMSDYINKFFMEEISSKTNMNWINPILQSVVFQQKILPYLEAFQSTKN